MNHHYPISVNADPLVPRLADALRDPRAVFLVASAWELSDAECASVLGFAPQAAWYWEQRIPVPFDPVTFARAAYIIGIHRSIVIDVSEEPATFVRRVMNLPRFPGKCILEVLTTGTASDMEWVCRYFAEQF